MVPNTPLLHCSTSLRRIFSFFAYAELGSGLAETSESTCLALGLVLFLKAVVRIIEINATNGGMSAWPG
jgi:hypothetical protein